MAHLTTLTKVMHPRQGKPSILWPTKVPALDQIIPYTKTEGNLSITIVPISYNNQLAQFILDHFFLWEWEGANLQHRLVGLVWLAETLAPLCDPGNPNRSVEGLVGDLSHYADAIIAAGLDEGLPSYAPLKPNRPPSSERMRRLARELEALNRDHHISKPWPTSYELPNEGFVYWSVDFVTKGAARGPFKSDQLINIWLSIRQEWGVVFKKNKYFLEMTKTYTTRYKTHPARSYVPVHLGLEAADLFCSAYAPLLKLTNLPQNAFKTQYGLI